jgi:hypothetical protein
MWNLINNNYICNEKDILRVHKIHLENLLNKKSYLNNKGPEIPYFLKNKLSLKELIRSNQSRINNDNHIMYKKLKHMANNPSPYSKFTNMPKYCPALDKLRFNYSKIERDNNIYNENESFFKRFSSKKSIYSTKKFLKQNEYENYLKNNISNSRFLPDIPLRMVTFRQFKSNLLRQTKKIRDNMKKAAMTRGGLTKQNKLIKSNSTRDLIRIDRNNIDENFRYNNNYLNNCNNLSSNDLHLINILTSKNDNKDMKRSQSALNINSKNSSL